MSLRFILGRAGTGKSTVCLREISRCQKEDPLGPPLILLVPEQSTHYVESALAHQAGLGGSLRAQVLSFQRLAWRLLEETGGAQRAPLSEVGKMMILKRILLLRRGELRALAASAEKPGMAGQIAQAIGECKTYRLQPEQLRSAQGLPPNVLDKLADLALLYQEYHNTIAGVLWDQHDIFALLADKIPLADSLDGAGIWVDGFKGFTPQEFAILEQLLRKAQTVHITLSLDVAENADHTDNESLFYTQRQTYQELTRLAYLTGTVLEQPLRLATPWRYHSEALEVVESALFSYAATRSRLQRNDAVKATESAEPAVISLLAAANRRKEVESAARKLQYWVREKGWRWRETGVVTRNLALYQEYIEQVFSELQIPFFLDLKRPVMHHPCVEFILSVLETATHWTYEPLFRCLKTDFFPLSRDRIDRLENYCLAYGIREGDWRREKPWDFGIAPAYAIPRECAGLQDDLLRELHEDRMLIRDALLPFADACREAQNAAQMTLALYQLLKHLNIAQVLSHWAEQERIAGRISQESYHLQIWDAVMRVLDELYTGLGEQVLSLAEYTAILISGLESLALGFIPPRVDQVVIGGLERSHHPEVRGVIVLGACEGEFPARAEPGGLFSASDREWMAQAGIPIAPKGLADIYDEQYYVYLACTRARECLTLSYPLMREDGQGVGVAPVVSRLKRLFPWLRETYTLDQPASDRHDASQPVTAEAYLREAERSLPPDLAESLYGRRMKTSVARLERFAACPFAHYAGYGLKLKERQIFEMGRRHIGDFFHDLLYTFGRELASQGRDWGALNKQEIEQGVKEHTRMLLQSQLYTSFGNTAKAQYLTGRLRRTVAYAAEVLAELSRRGEFRPAGLEITFGLEEDLPVKEIALDDGKALLLRGRIDRLDCLAYQHQTYLRVTDYKSSALDISLDQIFYGINLQLLAYLDIVLQETACFLADETGPSMLPAGFIYFPIREPDLKADLPLSVAEIAAQRRQALAIKGYLLADPAILERMDPQILTEGSELLGLKIDLAKERTSGRTKTMSAEEFELLRRYLAYWLKSAGERILSGEIAARPYRYAQKNACRYCAYHPVCHFNAQADGRQGRFLRKMQDDESLARMRERVCAAESEHSGEGAV
ncbi:MAG: PD-(D/E)XK nuclease family protein [Peptococcaceae bacterium]|nr:PD-(D/E)XK nuclease family protein [Peptococcaceae bacterium]